MFKIIFPKWIVRAFSISTANVSETAYENTVPPNSYGLIRISIVISMSAINVFLSGMDDAPDWLKTRA